MSSYDPGLISALSASLALPPRRAAANSAMYPDHSTS
jgi:hypothetical protein